MSNVVALPGCPEPAGRTGKNAPLGSSRSRSRRRRFGSIRKLPSGRYQASYHDASGTRHVAPHTYTSRANAERFLAAVETDMSRGDWIDPARLRMPLGEWVEIWWPLQAHLKPKTADGYASVIRCHILPHLGDVELGAINQLAVAKMVKDMREAGLSALSIRNAKSVLSAILSSAVANGYIKDNHCSRVKIPRDAPHEMCFLTPEQVALLAQEIAHPPKISGGGEHRRESYEDFGLAVELAASTGMRAGEQWALRKARVLPAEIEVRESLAESRGRICFGPVKNYQVRRVPVIPALQDELVGLVEQLEGDDDLVFTSPEGGPMHHGNFYRRHFKPAVRRAGLPERLRWHDLRHSFAAMLISSGAPARLIMQRLGHSSITVTMDHYGHLFSETDAEATEKLNRAFMSAHGKLRNH